MVSFFGICGAVMRVVAVTEAPNDTWANCWRKVVCCWLNGLFDTPSRSKTDASHEAMCAAFARSLQPPSPAETIETPRASASPTPLGAEPLTPGLRWSRSITSSAPEIVAFGPAGSLPASNSRAMSSSVCPELPSTAARRRSEPPLKLMYASPNTRAARDAARSATPNMVPGRSSRTYRVGLGANSRWGLSCPAARAPRTGEPLCTA